MTPANIIGMASLKELSAIAITDHNSCLNCAPAMKLGAETGLIVIPGMELTTSEEVHVLCLFPELDAALEFGRYAYERLLPVANKPGIFGEQLVMDENESIIGAPEKLLINATDISFDDVYSLLPPYGGVMVPAHINKNANSMIANLGFVPPDSRFRCYEYAASSDIESVVSANPYLQGCKSITDSDAHYLEDINEAVNYIHAREKSVRAILNALCGTAEPE